MRPYEVDYLGDILKERGKRVSIVFLGFLVYTPPVITHLSNYSFNIFHYTLQSR